MPSEPAPAEVRASGMDAGDEARMDDLWAALHLIWPTAWKAAMAPSQDEARLLQRGWLARFREVGLSRSEIQAAVDACARGQCRDNAWPPSLPEFIALARRPVHPDTARSHLSFRPIEEVLPRRLPPAEGLPAAGSDRSREVGREHLARLRALFDGQNTA